MRNIRRWSTDASSKKRALVLTGGGVRGAYQVGVAKCLIEQGIKFDFICGTSIGGLNAILIAQGDIDRLEELWCKKSGKDIFKFPSPLQLANLLLGNRLGLLDTQPMEQLIRREINLEKLKSSSTKVVLITTDVLTMDTQAVSTDDVQTIDELVNAAMATSALPGIFPPQKLHGKGMWIDGGLVKNTPMQAAINLGAQEIYLVLLNDEGATPPRNVLELLTRSQDIWMSASAMREIQIVNLYNWLLDEGASTGRPRIHIELFQPRQANMHLLDVDPAQSAELIRRGYEDVKERLEGTRRKIAITGFIDKIDIQSSERLNKNNASGSPTMLTKIKPVNETINQPLTEEHLPKEDIHESTSHT